MTFCGCFSLLVPCTHVVIKDLAILKADPTLKLCLGQKSEEISYQNCFPFSQTTTQTLRTYLLLIYHKLPTTIPAHTPAKTSRIAPALT